MPSRNEYFAENMTGKTISFNVQPYRHGKAVITKITPRVVKVSEFEPRRGRVLVEYEVFDLELDMLEGKETRSLIGGVPQGWHDLAGKTETLTGITFSQLWEAAEKGVTIIQAICG